VKTKNNQNNICIKYKCSVGRDSVVGIATRYGLDGPGIESLPRHVPFTWLLIPALHLWPPPRQNAILWLLGHLVSYTLQDHPTLELQDCIDFLRRSRWKTYLGSAHKGVRELSRCAGVIKLRDETASDTQLNNTLTTSVQSTCVSTKDAALTRTAPFKISTVSEKGGNEQDIDSYA
jgi:hypothetical protein